ncbi:hypothetical protein LTR50_005546 [Elasticomyces elasticus]|nr:hypothetical protein LTR50_005546 [Elasticomyces elasticus]
MLGGVSHPTSGGPLPPNLLDIYVRYKHDTRAIIAWLVSYGTRKYKRLQKVSTRDLMELAEIIRKKDVIMPENIDFYFREAIVARTQLSKFYRKTISPTASDQETIHHEYFTASLRKIHTDLCACCARSREECKRANPDCRSSGSEPVRSNRYALLNLSNPKHDNVCTEKTPSCPCEDDREEILAVASRAKATTPPLNDDLLGDAFEFYKDIQV